MNTLSFCFPSNDFLFDDDPRLDESRNANAFSGSVSPNIDRKPVKLTIKRSSKLPFGFPSWNWSISCQCEENDMTFVSLIGIAANGEFFSGNVRQTHCSHFEIPLSFEIAELLLQNGCEPIAVEIEQLEFVAHKPDPAESGILLFLR